jgi:hypothetical protein
MLCKACGINKRRQKELRAGRIRYQATCNSCYRAKRRNAGKPVRPTLSYRERYLKACCETCSFVPVHLIQLHLDHRDGNSANNKPSNFQTLCANCHALKTWVNGDWKTPSRQPVDGMGEQQLCLIH